MNYRSARVTPLLIALWSLGVCEALASTAGRPSRPHPTTVSQIEFHGWRDAVRISNGIVDVVVVPAIGRVMAYQFTGHPETNPLWINPDTCGRPPSAAVVWSNYGGDKLWPAPQGEWGHYLHQSRNWPPDPAIDPGQFHVIRIRNGIRLSGTRSAAFGLQISRDIVMPPGGTHVTLVDTFVRTREVTPSIAPLPVGIWSVTQTRGDEAAYVPFDPTSKVGRHGYIGIREGTPEPGVESNWHARGAMLVVTVHPGKLTKVGVDDSAGWIAGVDGNKVMFSERFTYSKSGPYLDNGTDAQVFTLNRPAYLEIELHSPGRNLKAGETMSRSVVWQLQRLHRTPHTIAEIRNALGRPGA
jgi:hypothetical protein